MEIIKMLINSVANGIISDIDKMIKKNKEKMTVVKMTSLTSLSSLVFAVCFLLGNFTSMLAILFAEQLGCGLLFPLSSCVFLYSVCIVSLRNIYLFNKEKNFFVRKLDYDKNIDNGEQ